MESSEKPRIDLAKKVLPPALFQALKHIFSHKIEGLALVGGTAIAGFYAGHRKSDDLDLFTATPEAQEATWRAAHSLKDTGTEFLKEFRTAHFTKFTCRLKKHLFTIDIVLDPNLFRIGTFHQLEGGVCVADLSTLLKTKASTLISRCGEKDLYDLFWIFEKFPDLSFEKLIEMGKEVDGGMTGEAMLMVMADTQLRKEACGFGLKSDQTTEAIFELLKKFKQEMILSLSKYLHKQPAPPLADLVHKIKKLM